MSNPQLLSNEASPLKQMLISTSEWDAFSYSVRSNAPNMARQRIEISGSNQPEFGRRENFVIPRYGLWASATLRIELEIDPEGDNTQATDTERVFSNWIAPYLLGEISLNTHNKVIQQIWPQNIVQEAVYGRESNYRATMSEMMGEHDRDTKLRYHENVAGAATNYARKKLTYLVPLPLCFMDSTSSFLDTSFVETLNLSVMLAQQDSFVGKEFEGKAAGTLGTVLHSGAQTTAAGTRRAHNVKSITLLCDFIAVTDATRKALQTSNYAVDRPLTQLNYNYFQETAKEVTILANELNIQECPVPLKCNGLCSHTYWRVVPTEIGASGAANATVHTHQIIKNPGNTNNGVVYNYGQNAAANAALGDEPELKTPGWMKVQLKASGVVLVEYTQEELLMGFGGGYARGLSATSAVGGNGVAAQAFDVVGHGSTTDGMNTICWGLDSRSSGGAYDSGSQSFKELVDPQLVVTFSKGVPLQYKFRVEVFHKVHVLNSISSSDGRITQSISV